MAELRDCPECNREMREIRPESWRCTYCRSTWSASEPPAPSQGPEAMTVREACRKRRPLDGADAQALEGALTQAEEEIAALRAENEKLKQDLHLAVSNAGKDLIRERDEWKQHAEVGIALRKEEWAERIDLIRQLEAAIKERDRAIARAALEAWRNSVEQSETRQSSGSEGSEDGEMGE